MQLSRASSVHFRSLVLQSVLIISLTCLISQASFAQAFYTEAFARANAGSEFGSNAQSNDSGYVSGAAVESESATASYSLSNPPGQGSANSSDTTGLGQIVASASDSFDINNLGESSVTASSATSGQFGDTITIDSSTLKAGTAVTIDAELVETGEITANGSFGTGSIDASTYNYGLANLGTLYGSTNSTTKTSFTEEVGNTFTISGIAGVQPSINQSVAGTASYYLSVVEPGASLASAGGQNYSPVPEASTFASFGIMIAGICGLVFVRRRLRAIGHS